MTMKKYEVKILSPHDNIELLGVEFDNVKVDGVLVKFLDFDDDVVCCVHSDRLVSVKIAD